MLGLLLVFQHCVTTAAASVADADAAGGGRTCVVLPKAASAAEVNARCAIADQPCLIKGGLATAGWAPHLDLDSLLERFPGQPFKTQGFQNTTTLKAYLDEPASTGRNTPAYIWDGASGGAMTSAMSALHASVPERYAGAMPAFKAGRISTSMFSLGKRGSGFYWHVHGPAITGLFSGRKRWFFYTTKEMRALPAEAKHGLMDPDGHEGRAHSTKWAQETLPSIADGMRPIECLQEAGDFLFLPDKRHHSTINLEDVTAGVTWEAVRKVRCMGRGASPDGLCWPDQLRDEL